MKKQVVQKNSIKEQVKKLSILSEKLSHEFLSGSYKSVFKGLGLEFDEVRNYIESDDSRFIDWNVSARLSSPYVKVFKEEKEVNLHLVVDNSLSLQIGSQGEKKSDVCNFLVSLFSHLALNNSDKISSLFFDEEIYKLIKPAKGKKHVNYIIQQTLNRDLRKGSNLALALKTTYEELKKRSIVIIISDFHSGNYYKELSLLAKKHDLMAIRINDSLDTHFAYDGLIHLQDSESDKYTSVMGSDKLFKKEYHDYWGAKRIEWLNQCQKRKVAYLEIDTKDDVFKKLYFYFKKRK